MPTEKSTEVIQYLINTILNKDSKYPELIKTQAVMTLYKYMVDLQDEGSIVEDIIKDSFKITIREALDMFLDYM